MRKLRVYLDHCAYNRPFDEQSQMIVHLESVAVQFIQELIRNEKIELIWSYINERENQDHPFEEHQATINQWADIATHCPPMNEIPLKAAEIMKYNVKTLDALHIACAVITRCDYFITTDIPLLKKADKIEGVKVISPIGFVRMLGDDNASENEIGIDSVR
jgi:predicted nucleic acid-binding protein